MLRLQKLNIIESKDALRGIPEGKVLINTINAHSYNVAQKEKKSSGPNAKAFFFGSHLAHLNFWLIQISLRSYYKLI